MALIFSFSAQNAESSSSLSGGTIEVILKTVIKDFGGIPAERQAAMISAYQFAVRKSAHFLAYMMLGILSMTALFQYSLESKRRFTAA
jgi:VanZ family protein